MRKIREDEIRIEVKNKRKGTRQDEPNEKRRIDMRR